MTILEALNWGRDEIRKTLPEKVTKEHNPMIDAQVLLSFALKKSTAYIFCHFEDNISKDIESIFKEMIFRRVNHEPIAHIIGTKAFYKRRFTVNKNVLIPRPETEQLVEEAINHISDTSTIIDVGTGSGAIAITIAAETHQPVIAIDIDHNALAVAKTNAKTHDVENLISFLHGNLLEPYIKKNIRDHQSANTIITANLPYEKIQTWQTLDPDVTQFEPRHAIVGGASGLELYENLLKQIKTHRDLFSARVDVFFEINPAQELSVPHLIKKYFPNALIQVKKDLAGKSRIITATF